MGCALCVIFMILVSHENVKKCVLGGCTITSKTKINVVWNFFSLRCVDFSLWGKQWPVHYPAKMRPKLWKSHIVLGVSWCFSGLHVRIKELSCWWSCFRRCSRELREAEREENEEQLFFACKVWHTRISLIVLRLLLREKKHSMMKIMMKKKW